MSTRIRRFHGHPTTIIHPVSSSSSPDTSSSGSSSRGRLWKWSFLHRNRILKVSRKRQFFFLVVVLSFVTLFLSFEKKTLHEYGHSLGWRMNWDHNDNDDDDDGNFQNNNDKDGSLPTALRMGTQVTYQTHGHYFGRISSPPSNQTEDMIRWKMHGNSSVVGQVILPTIVVQLNGELGNHLSGIAHGRGIQLWALQQYGIETNLLLLRQRIKQPSLSSSSSSSSALWMDNPKWKSVRQQFRTCFPALRRWKTILQDRQANQIWKDVQIQQQKQQTWLSPHNQTILDRINGKRKPPLHKGWRIVSYSNSIRQPLEPQDLQASLQLFQQLLRQTSTTSMANPRISFPFLYAESMDIFLLVDHYYDEFRALFAMEDTKSACCQQRPFPNETVLVRPS